MSCYTFNMKIPVIYEDNNFIVIDKPAGTSVHPARTSELVQSGRRVAGVRGETIVDWLVQQYPEVKKVGDDPTERPGIVHRLDKGTSGVMIIARNQDAFESLKHLFKERVVAKKYLALVVGSPKRNAGAIDAAIGRSLRNPTKRATGSGTKGSRSALTRYRVLERFNGFALVEAEPKTGRMHQIRVHLASIGYPVAGDRTYGKGRSSPDGLDRPFLHAWRLAFSFPEGHGWQFESALPADLQGILKKLRMLRRRA